MIICPVCHSNNSSKVVAPYRCYSTIFFGCHRAVCSICEMSFAYPMPSKDILSIYNKSYFSKAHAGKPSNKSALAFYSGISRLRSIFVQKFLDTNKINVERVLELGPGLGFFAKCWLEKFPLTSYYAVETDVSCHDYLMSLGVKFIELQNPLEIDLVVMSHVLEHTTDPINFIKSATRGLKKGGLIFIEVPCQDWKHKEFDEPHVLFFDKKSIEYLLVKLNFFDIKTAYYGTPLSKLKKKPLIYKIINKIRGILINFGILYPFSKISIGLEELSCPLERAIVSPYLAHRESDDPAWWLRVIARKN